MPLGRVGTVTERHTSKLVPRDDKPPLIIPRRDGGWVCILTKASGTIIQCCPFNWARGTQKMLCTKRPPIRNLIDLSDPRQVRTLKRRLGISGTDLRRIVEKVGNSIAAITKEVELERTHAPTNTDGATL